jgi:hypothetical protein
MPTKRLPASLVRKLERVANRLLTPKRFVRWKNVDHRKDWPGAEPNEIDMWGGRVRELTLRKGKSPVGVIIKRQSPKILIELKERVQRSRENPHPSYIILAPRVYPLNDKFVAMAKMDKPSIAEILGLGRDWGKESITPRGTQYFKHLQERYSVTTEQLEEAMEHAYKITGFDRTNLLLIGIRNHKFIFMPLADLW